MNDDKKSCLSPDLPGRKEKNKKEKNKGEDKDFPKRFIFSENCIMITKTNSRLGNKRVLIQAYKPPTNTLTLAN
jgi:hypothetical protein